MLICGWSWFVGAVADVLGRVWCWGVGKVGAWIDPFELERSGGNVELNKNAMEIFRVCDRKGGWMII